MRFYNSYHKSPVQKQKKQLGRLKERVHLSLKLTFKHLGSVSDYFSRSRGFFKNVKINSLRSQFYQHLHHGYCHHYCIIISLLSQQAITCSKLTILYRKRCESVQSNNKDTRTTSMASVQ